MTSKSQGLKDRSEVFAINVVKFCETLPNTIAGRRIGEQLLDAGTSVACNYRAACRAFTRPLFISKLAVVGEEADESEFWLGLIIKTGLSTVSSAVTLRQEASELTAIFTASLRTARGRKGKQGSSP
jgi:four helix bundle protein